MAIETRLAAVVLFAAVVICGCSKSGDSYLEAAKFVEVEQAKLDAMVASRTPSPRLEIINKGSKFADENDPKYKEFEKEQDAKIAIEKEQIERQAKVVADAIKRRDAMAPGTSSGY
jgi:hypothetical protein